MMMVKSDCFFQEMLKLFPQTILQYEEMKTQYGRVLETVAIEDIFMPYIIDLLESNQDLNLIHDMFDLFERVCRYGEQHLLDVFTTTILESIGNNQDILHKAENYMGPATKLLQIEADKHIGRK